MFLLQSRQKRVILLQ